MAPRSSVRDSLHRTTKWAMDAKNMTYREAMNWLENLRLNVQIDDDQAVEPAGQAALLSAVAIARRTFMGGVAVQGSIDIPVRVRFPRPCSLREVVRELGGNVEGVPVDAPTILIGRQTPRLTAAAGFCVRTIQRGWSGGIVPADSQAVVEEGGAVALTGMLSSALAVGEAFRFAAGERSAGQTPMGLCLWDPRRETDWLRSSAPDLELLPSLLWLVGLGHLGQAFLWGLSMLPYGDHESAVLLLQDHDTVTESTESTSILSESSQLGRLKTRVVADWVERRGFETRIIERKFDPTVHPQQGEPRIAFCGIDNLPGRRELNVDAFDLIVEAGLGAEQHDFDCLRIHTLPGPRSPREIWPATIENAAKRRVGSRDQGSRFVDGELDECGLVDLDGIAVGAPFVGAVAATISLAEILRVLHDGPAHQVIDLSLREIDCRQLVRNPRIENVAIPHVTAGY